MTWGTHISVKRFGAKGDGTTDDTTALQAAINSGEKLFLPPGTFMTSKLTATTGLTIVGSGKGGYPLSADPLWPGQKLAAGKHSTLKLIAATNDEVLEVPTTAQYLHLANLAIDGNRANQTNDTGHGIAFLDDASANETQSRLADVFIHSCSKSGLYVGLFRQAVYSSELVITNCYNNGVELKGNDSRINGALIGINGENTNKDLIYVGADVIDLIACEVFSHRVTTHIGNGIKIEDGVKRVRIIGGTIDRCNGHGLYVGAASRATVTGTTFHSNSANADNTYSHIGLGVGAMVMTLGLEFTAKEIANDAKYAVDTTDGTCSAKGKTTCFVDAASRQTADDAGARWV